MKILKYLSTIPHPLTDYIIPSNLEWGDGKLWCAPPPCRNLHPRVSEITMVYILFLPFFLCKQANNDTEAAEVSILAKISIFLSILDDK